MIPKFDANIWELLFMSTLGLKSLISDYFTSI